MGKGVLLLLLTSCCAHLWAQPPSSSPSKYTLRSTARVLKDEGDIKAINFDLNGINLARRIFPDLKGKSVIIGQKENAPDPRDVDLAGRLIPSSVTAAQITPHATTIATLLVGAGYSSPLNLGVAPLAKLLSVNANQLAPEPDEFYRQHVVTVMNHSYGTEIEPFYDKNAAAYDATAWRIPELLQVFSAGNIGYTTSASGPYANLPAVANITGAFKLAKNVLTVGAVNELGELLPASSRGPAYDGRIKPELVAYGDEGTSGAAALVSGVAALLQEQYQLQHHTPAPAALLKAILINSADDVGLSGIDHQTGYGNLNAVKALKTLALEQYMAGRITSGDTVEYKLTVPAAQQLKITLNWSDSAAVPYSSQALVNDLDLEVVDETGKHWLPWVLSTFPHADSLLKPAGRGLDRLNTIEQVSLSPVQPMTYIIRVIGKRLRSQQQPFYLAYQWNESVSFSWAAPCATSPVFSDSIHILRWQYSGVATTAQLEQTIDAGLTWTLVDEQIDLSKGLYLWRSPKLLTQCRLRMVISDKYYLSDTFVVSPSIATTVLFQCADSLGLAWSSSIDSTGLQYVLYRFRADASTWKKIGLVSGNRIVLKNESSTDLFAVEPVNATGSTGLRSDLFNGLQQHVFCYYTDLTATSSATSVAVQCHLTDAPYVKAVTFQKQTGEGFHDWLTLPITGADRSVTVTDTNPQPGGNTYRIKLQLKAGSTYYSDPVTALFNRSPTVFVYPNPVRKGQSITVQTTEYGQFTLQLINAIGRVVSEDQFTGNETQLNTELLVPGSYIYRVLLDNQSWAQGRLLVQ